MLTTENTFIAQADCDIMWLLITDNYLVENSQYREKIHVFREYRNTILI